MSERRKPSEPPWPSPHMLETWGLVRCAGNCSTFVNPTLDLYPEDNEGRRFCQRHQRRDTTRSQPRRATERSLAELRFAPRPEKRRRDDRRWAA